jgi:hypothetical protein
MSRRELFLVTPYQPPGSSPATVSAADAAAFLNGYAALWLPAALAGASGPPRVVSPSELPPPEPGHLFAVAQSPPPVVPEDWYRRLHEAGAAAFKATGDRVETVANLQAALALSSSGDHAAALVRPFGGIGFGFLIVNALFRAMEHEDVLPLDEFWQDVQAAARTLAGPDPDAARTSLQSAADRLRAAREVLYPVAIHVVDLVAVDPQRPVDLPSVALGKGMPVNLLAASSFLEELARANPDALGLLRKGTGSELTEVCGGCYVEREDDLLPFESQLWNLLKGLATARDITGDDVRVFARRSFGFHAQLPALLAAVGLQRAVFHSFVDGLLPRYQSAVVAWTAPDGRPIDCFARAPYPAEDANTFFQLGHHLYQTIMQDHAATLALAHGPGADCPAYADWLELSRFGPVLGQWTTLSRYLAEVMAGEYVGSVSPDDFHADHLSERVGRSSARPVSAFADHARRRRQLDTGWTLAALGRGLMGPPDALRLVERLSDGEDRIEREETGAADAELAKVLEDAAGPLVQRLLARAPADEPGYLLLNPCGFPRRVGVELGGAEAALPVAGPVKACQLDGTVLRAVVEVPALGYAWLPRAGTRPDTAPAAARMRLADERHVRNEFFEAEIDPETGGLRGLRDFHARQHRLGEQLVFNPGSTMKATALRITSAGHALGELVTEGVLAGEHGQELARFRQRFRAWLGRPVLELRIEIEPLLEPAGYAWHAYYAARFAWRDERARLLRGVNGAACPTSHTRPQAPDFLELRQGRQNVVIFPGGLPFHQRHGTRMLDVLLIVPGESARTFDLALGLDRDHPMLTAQGLLTPTPCLSVVKGPPHVGASGWLFHLDAPHLLLTSMRPAPMGADGVVARVLECGQVGGEAEFRCPRDPLRAEFGDARGESRRPADLAGDAVRFEIAPGGFLEVRVDFA